ncbi:MAG: glycoside hydrolase family 26 protein, partial [Desulfobacterales bacterium]|nr:glycoside hydrolase family 26 protein [Desulfobacterales bacterium]
MKTVMQKHVLVILLLSLFASMDCFAKPITSSVPINPHASAEVRRVLKTIYDIKAKGQILSAQHLYLVEDYNEVKHVKKLTGKYPAVVEFDLLGFNKSPRKKEQYFKFAKDWYRKGGLIAVSWHETNPELAVLDEGGYAHGTKKKMDQERFNQVITPGTELYKRWLEHLDFAAQW